MSLLYDHPVPIHTTFIVKTVPEKGGSDVALLGTRLWQLVTPAQTNGRICLSIKSLHVEKSSHSTQHHAFLCWAILDQDVFEDSLVIPPTWLKCYNHVFHPKAIYMPSSKCLAILQVQPVPLTEIVLTAFSSDAYSAASKNDSVLEKYIEHECPILRQGDVLIFSSGCSDDDYNAHPPCQSFQYRVDMVEPVLQGYAIQDRTNIILALESLNGTKDIANLASDSGEEFVDQDRVEIDESFLANAISSIPNYGRSESSTPTLGNMGSFPCIPLSLPISIIDDHFSLYLRASDLGRIGIISGDWAVVTAAGTQSRKRLVRIIAHDSLIISGAGAGCPTLLHNISPEWSEPLAYDTKRLCLYPSPFGPREPVIPTARSITIARIATPLSINRTYQHLFLNCLKTYFNKAKRLVKKGDIVCLSLDTDESRFSEIVTLAGDLSQDINIIDPRFPSTCPRLNEAIFFIITNIEHDIVAHDPQSLSEDAYMGSTMGELGCWVDAVFTRITQAGVEHARVPDLGVYMQSDQESPRSAFDVLRNLPSRLLIGLRSPFMKIIELTSAGLAKNAMDYNLNLSILLKGTRGCGKFTTVSWAAERLGLHIFEVNCYDIIGDNDANTEATLRVRFDQAKSCSPCMLILRHLEALSTTTQIVEPGKDSTMAAAIKECVFDVQQSWKVTGYPVLILGTTCDPASVPVGILSCFKHEIAFEAPNDEERQEILQCLLQNCSIAPDVSVASLATQTAALVAADLVDLVSRAKSASVIRAAAISDQKISNILDAGILLTAADFEIALGKARTSYSQSIGAPNIPNVSWDDVGGLVHVKSDILDTIQLPLDHPELFADGLKKRSGILLYGPPGTGKTLVAKAVATSCSLNFFSVKGPELLNMYIGESEANVRKVFQRARDAKPCVIFFDELDSVAPKRGNHGDSGGVMDRIVSQLLAELDGMSGGKAGADVFVIGATNRPDLLDPALLRPGRFDRMLYLGVSETHEAQLNILEALTRKFRLDPGLDLRTIAEQCPFNYTGADFYALCSDAMLNAMSRKAEELEIKLGKMNKQPEYLSHPLTPQYFLAELASPDDITVFVSQNDFNTALASLVPSVTKAEMEHYAQVQRRFSQEVTIEE
ncbi:P-loop containing nucleoside triphosphate hydrolase protein [Crucibulum laeve]|uniref:Peroxisomal ATPase PEX6 n=1 Tax=Crucibulum laeve TaxID=68775 RepID=A0A5C3MBN1_9AGAR|nr:P-loop containing nucleoside triphosphate hydrolase protein [Crucibulum laeve]